MPADTEKNKALANRGAPFHQLWTPSDGHSPEYGVRPIADEYGVQPIQVFGPDGEALDAESAIPVRILRYELIAVEWTIPINDSITSEIGIDGLSMGILWMPSAWTAANITFQIGQWSNGSFWDLYDENGSEVVVTAAAARAIPLPPEVVAASFIKIRSGTTGTPVNQVAERTGWIVAKG